MGAQPKYPRLTGDQMVRVKAIAPMDLAAVFTEWLKRWSDAMDKADPTVHPLNPDEEAVLGCLDGLGPIFPVGGETEEHYGERIAAGVFHLLKEA